MNAGVQVKTEVDSNSYRPATDQSVIVEYDRSSLDELFKVVAQDGGTAPPQSSYRWKNLPASFFEEPSKNRSVLTTIHSRSVSSPANLHQNLSPAARPIPQHGRQGSCDGFLDSAAVSGDGFGMSRQQPTSDKQSFEESQGGVYSVPRPDMSLNLHQQPAQLHRPSSLSPTLSSTLGALPCGWEQGLTAAGEVYFINHNDQTTSWNDPRLTVKGDPVSQQQAHLHIHHHHQQQQQLAAEQASRRILTNQQFIENELAKIQQEKLRIQRQQEALAQKETLLTEMMSRSVISSPPIDTSINAAAAGIPLLRSPSSSSSSGSGAGVVGAMMAPPCNNPTMTSAGGLTGPLTMSRPMCGPPAAVQARLSSADSGLGGVSGMTYSLPRTSDYLEEQKMDVVSDTGQTSVKLIGGGVGYNMMSMDTNVGQQSLMMDPTDCFTEIPTELMSQLDDHNADGTLTWL